MAGPAGSAFVELTPKLADGFQQSVQRQVGQPIDTAMRQVTDNAGRAGAKAGDEFGQRFYRDANGRLRDVITNRFASAEASSAGTTAGRQFGDSFSDSARQTAHATGMSAGGRFRDGFRERVGGIGRDLAGIFAAVSITRIIGDSIAEAEDALVVARQTEAVLESTGGAAQVTAEHVGDLADRLAMLAGIDNDVVQAGENLLLTFTNIQNTPLRPVFDEAALAALDMSSAMGTDLNSAVVLVGKALNDPIAGLTALSRVGVQLTQEQKDQIALFMLWGDTAGAQGIILDELTRQFGGSAEANATASGRWQTAIDGLKESIGMSLLPVIERLTPKIEEFSTAVQNANGPTRDLGVALGLLVGAVVILGVTFGGIAAAIGGAIGGILVGIWWIHDNWATVTEAFSTMYDTFVKPVLADLFGRLMNIAATTMPLPIMALGLLAKAVDGPRAALRGLGDLLSWIVSFRVGNLGFPDLAGAISGALGPAGRLLDTLRNIANTPVDKAFNSVPQPKALGGPVSAMRPYIVGERGPELFVPAVSGQIVTAGQTASLMNRMDFSQMQPMGGDDPFTASFGGVADVFLDSEPVGRIVAGGQRTRERGTRAARR